MKLYELSREYETLSNLWETGEIPDEAARDTLEGIAGEAEEKADNIACMVKNLNAEAKAMKEERTSFLSAERLWSTKWITSKSTCWTTLPSWG